MHNRNFLSLKTVLLGGIALFALPGSAFAQQIAGLGHTQFVQISHYSTTFGTAKKPSRASGAFFRIAAC